MLLRRAKYLSASSYLIAFWVVIYFMVILQDYFFSALRQTGFYWSEVSLFNIYWLLFIPFCWVASLSLKKYSFQKQNTVTQIFVLVGLAFIFSVVHLIFFSGLISGISALVFTPSHSFKRTLIGSLSKDYWISFIIYGLVPYLLFWYKNGQANTFHKPVLNFTLGSGREKEIAHKELPILQLKQGHQIIRIDQSAILYIKADKPYSRIVTLENQYLSNQSLKALSAKLQLASFVRIHRSAIVNTAQIQKMTSRKNGDYDVTLISGDQLRCSRHFRENWEHLLVSST